MEIDYIYPDADYYILPIPAKLTLTRAIPQHHFTDVHGVDICRIERDSMWPHTVIHKCIYHYAYVMWWK